jgi:hypothetical protein
MHRHIFGAIILAAMVSSAGAETVTLQQGADGYSGCVTATRWPEKPFAPRGWGATNGDGMLFYPGPDGPFSSVRFENIRDGIEDWEGHLALRD